MTQHASDELARVELKRLAERHGMNVFGGTLRRTSSRFCLGVEHGDYNGTELFGVGTDRFIWAAYRPNDSGRVRLVSKNFEADGVVEFTPGQVPQPGSPEVIDSWARFPFGIDYIMRKMGLETGRGMDVVIFGNIPGGGMSRSASLLINLTLAYFDINAVPVENGLQIVDLTQRVENDYIGSPCGKLDMTMIYFARAGMGTHYRPQDRSIAYVPLGEGAEEFRILSLDTGTVRPGLEKSTYSIRAQECVAAVEEISKVVSIQHLGDVRDPETFAQVASSLRQTHPQLADRFAYIYRAQSRFPQMLSAWRRGDMVSVGQVFREDGRELRDLYRISGPELETMCDIVRTVPGVLGERMLGGGDKGAAGALVRADAVDAVQKAVALAYPRSYPEYADQWAVHACAVVDGVSVLEPL
jgi:galactokinase